MKRHRKLSAIAILLVVACLSVWALAGCQGTDNTSPAQDASDQTAKPAATVTSPVLRDENFGGIYIDMTIEEFNAAGFTYGDSVDIAFSNGFSLEGIPYYNGYYTSLGDPLLVAYPGYPHIRVGYNNGEPMWDVSKVTENDTATVTLAEPGKYRDIQEAFDITYSDERKDYASDEIFANFRAVKVGQIKPNTLYRSASPIDNEHNRTSFVTALAKNAHIGFILDLSDNDDEIAEFVKENKANDVDDSLFCKLHDQGRAIGIDLGAGYPSEEYAKKLADGLIEMSEHEGPYLVHCVEGKDRTGFVCLLLEALAGASYDEMLADYMTTFDNYYGINEQSDPDKFQAIVGLNFVDMIEVVGKAEQGADLSKLDYASGARSYLHKGGMSDAQIDKLVQRLCK